MSYQNTFSIPGAGAWIKGTFIPANKQNIQEQDLDNYEKWVSLYPQWPVLSKNEKKNIKARHRKMMQTTVTDVSPAISKADYYVPQPTVTYTLDTRGIQWNNTTLTADDVRFLHKKKEEETMTFNLDQTRLDHLTRRLFVANGNQDLKLRQHFGLEDDNRPATAKEFVQRIKDGKFTLRDEDSEDCYYTDADFAYNIRWRDPSVKEDKDGYTAAKKNMEAAYNAAKDQIYISSPEAGLKALQEFESATFH